MTGTESIPVAVETLKKELQEWRKIGEEEAWEHAYTVIEVLCYKLDKVLDDRRERIALAAMQGMLAEGGRSVEGCCSSALIAARHMSEGLEKKEEN